MNLLHAGNRALLRIYGCRWCDGVARYYGSIKLPFRCRACDRRKSLDLLRLAVAFILLAVVAMLPRLAR